MNLPPSILRRSAVAATAWAVLGAGCQSPISNSVFDEDLEYLDAVPTRMDQRIDVRGDAADDDDWSVDDEAPPTTDGEVWSRDLMLGVAWSLNSASDDLLGFVDMVRSSPPTSRASNQRTWGPYDTGDSDGTVVQLVVKKLGVGQFSWAIEWSPAGGQDWTTYAAGDHFAGTSVAAGDGTYVVDFDSVATLQGHDAGGAWTVDYDHRETRQIAVSVADFWDGDPDDIISAEYYYAHADGVADFEFQTDNDLDAEGIDHWSIRARVLDDGGGRADATAETEDGYVVRLSQCWSPDAALVYQADDRGLVEVVGTEDACAFEAFAEVEHI